MQVERRTAGVSGLVGPKFTVTAVGDPVGPGSDCAGSPSCWGSVCGPGCGLSLVA